MTWLLLVASLVSTTQDAALMTAVAQGHLPAQAGA